MPAITEVFFATNRKPDPHVPGGFGGDPVDPTNAEAVTYAVATVAGIDLADAGSGRITAITDTAMGAFSEPVRDRILATGRNLLISIHGFDNDFIAAITRAAYVREWFAATGEAAADTTMVAFTWPSLGSLLQYHTDQQHAGASGLHIAFFLRLVASLIERHRQVKADSRVFLHAHSMGNHALQAGISTWDPAGLGLSDMLFDEVFHTAADEVADAYEQPANRGLGLLRLLSGRISVYFSRRDPAMALSWSANHNIRLGYDGPAHKHDPQLYPTQQFRSIDCTEVFDFNPLAEVLASHQYYRRSPTVRDDITAAMAGKPVAPGVSALHAGLV